MTNKRDIDYLLEEVVTLPSLPGTISRITHMLEDPDCSLSEVGKAIATDPSIALKTLRLVNSAYYGLREKVTSVEHAVVLLGMKVVKNLVFTATVFDTLKSSEGSFLRHSIACGLAMRTIVEIQNKELPIESTDEAFICGLLHDIGKVIFEQFLPDEYGEVVEASKTSKTPSRIIELEIIGADHAEMGGRLASKWKLADPLIEAIAGHHDISRCKEQSMTDLASMLSVADYICCASGISVFPGEEPEVSDEMWAATGLSVEDIQDVLNSFFASLPMLDELIQAAQ